MQITTAQGNIHFIYDATGRKWAKSGPDGLRWYVDNAEFLDGKIQHVAFPDGRFVAEYDENGTFQGTYRVEYLPCRQAGFRTDHPDLRYGTGLGNTRLTFSDFNHDMVITTRDDPQTPRDETEITSENHYYPFGLSHTGPWYASIAPENKYRYNGKEWNEDWGLNMYDYGARWYMPDLGRWGGVDALAEKFPLWSSYSYAFNNAIQFIDPDGRAPQSPIFGQDGKFLGTDSEGFKGDIVIMREKTYNALTNNGKNTLDHSLTKKIIGTGNSFFAQTLDDFVANDFDIANYNHTEFLSNVFTNLLSAAKAEGLISYDVSSVCPFSLNGAQTIDVQVLVSGIL